MKKTIIFILSLLGNLRTYYWWFTYGERHDISIDEYKRKLSYPQTGFLFIRFRRKFKLLKFSYWLCGLITKHEISETDWGYGGGDMCDYWCRWCDKLFQMPKREEISNFRKDLMESIE